MKQDRWVTIEELYSLVETNVHLDKEDIEPDSPGSLSPKWKRNVRNVLQTRKTRGEILWNGKGSYMISGLVGQELTRSGELWQSLLTSGDPAMVPPAFLRSLRIYGGAQGIWVDKKATTGIDPLGVGATVSVLHTGKLYDDDIADDGLIYHYPDTDRPSTRDEKKSKLPKMLGSLGYPYS